MTKHKHKHKNRNNKNMAGEANRNAGKSKKKKIVKDSIGFTASMRRALRYSLPLIGAIVFYEIMLRMVIGGGSAVTPLTFLLFVPAEGLAFAILFGWNFRKDIINRIVAMVPMLLITGFYMVEMLYYRVFGSLFSVSMIGMGGDAIDNFGWALLSTVRESFVLVLIFLIPIAVWAFYVFRKKPELPPYDEIHHLSAAASALILWLLASSLLGLGGTGPQSAFQAYHSTLIDTDTGSGKLGALTNCILETKGYFFGSNATKGDLLSEEQSQIADEEMNKNETASKHTDTSPNVIKALDFEALKEETEDEEFKELCDYFTVKEGTNKNKYTGIFKGYNLIYITAESFSRFAVDEEVTPVLYKLSHEGIILNNFYNSFRNTTTNGEYAFLTGIWPDISRKANMGTAVGSMAQSADKYMPFGLGTLFSTQQGTNSYGYHNYKGAYYDREKSLPNLGFTCKFMNEGMTFTSRWPSSDLEMFEQSVGDYINDDQFVAYYMTFSGHGPYTEDNNIYNKNIDEVNELTADRDYTDVARGYLACNMELEKGLEYLMDELEKAGKLENTVIVLTGDHYPYYLDEESCNSIAGEEVDPDFEHFRSDCIIWNGGLEKPIVNNNCCCNIDILPTVLNLFGIEYDSRLLPGTDVFSNGLHMAVLYNKSIVTGLVKYNAGTGDVFWNSSDDGYVKLDLNQEESEDNTVSDVEAYDEIYDIEEVKSYIDYLTNEVNVRYSASLKMMESDFMKWAWETAGLKEPDVEEDPESAEADPESVEADTESVEAAGEE